MQVTLIDALNGPYPYVVLGLGLLLGAIGLPVPASLMATVAGGLMADGDLDPTTTLTVALAACLAGDLLGYTLGRFGARQFGCPLGRTPVVRAARWLPRLPRWDSIERSFSRRAGVTLVLTRSVLAIAASAISLLAGASRHKFTSFFAYSLLGRGLWVVLFVGIGYAFAGSAVSTAEADALSGFSGAFGLLGIALLALVVHQRPTRAVAHR